MSSLLNSITYLPNQVEEKSDRFPNTAFFNLPTVSFLTIFLGQIVKQDSNQDATR